MFDYNLSLLSCSTRLVQTWNYVTFEEIGDAVHVTEDGLVSWHGGGDEASVNADRAVDEDEVGVALWTCFQRIHKPGKGLAAESEGEFVARFGDAEEFKVGPALVTDEGLVDTAVTIQDLNHGVVDKVLEVEEEVKVAEADVGVDGDHGEAETGEGEAGVGGGGGLAHTILVGGDDSDVGVELESSGLQFQWRARAFHEREERRGTKRENLKFTLLKIEFEILFFQLTKIPFKILKFWIHFTKISK